LKISQDEPKPQGARQPLDYILNSFNNFLEVLIDELLDSFPPCKEVDHRMGENINRGTIWIITLVIILDYIQM
jgi:hypothetical protein